MLGAAWSYVLGGRGMIVDDDEALEGDIGRDHPDLTEHPVLVYWFIDDAVEIDDVIFDGQVFLGGVMEHIEEAGIHSGDSACALPPITLGAREIDRIEATQAIARGVGVLG